MGFAAEQQLALELHRALSWSSLRDMLAARRHLDLPAEIFERALPGKFTVTPQGLQRETSGFIGFLTAPQASPGGVRCNGLPYSSHSGTAWAARRHWQRPGRYSAAICTATPYAGPAPTCPAPL
ncbi:hypothetical protein [Leisingera sp. MMG026]|uniref:hypothetical protein n=1 Tax=Leisingera sp. MMG026 TaxID=2909982 RepID=UPI001F3E3514|nr:hypothetical protein [Leisingera sp. MMG026]MCF6433228.1 hypothetical protein [Leisingera sp. MMG026]